MIETLTFTVTVASGDTATVAVIEGECGHVVSTGTAKLHPNDFYNEGIGFDLAVARAFIEYGQALENEALDMSALLN